MAASTQRTPCRCCCGTRARRRAPAWRQERQQQGDPKVGASVSTSRGAHPLVHSRVRPHLPVLHLVDCAVHEPPLHLRPVVGVEQHVGAGPAVGQLQAVVLHTGGRMEGERTQQAGSGWRSKRGPSSPAGALAYKNGCPCFLPSPLRSPACRTESLRGCWAPACCWCRGPAGPQCTGPRPWGAPAGRHETRRPPAGQWAGEGRAVFTSAAGKRWQLSQPRHAPPRQPAPTLPLHRDSQ